MTAPGPEPAAPVTPGRAEEDAARAACEAFVDARMRGMSLGDPWNSLDDDQRAAWKAAVRAAIAANAIGGILTAVKASSGDLIAIAFNRRLDMKTAHELTERWKGCAPDVTLLIVDDVAAIEPRQPAPGLGTAWRLLDETRALVAEILAERPAVTSDERQQDAEWRQRAGLDG